MSQDVLICVMNSTAVFNDVNVEMQSSESCVKCLNIDAELLSKQSAYNDLSKSYLQIEKHCIYLELTMQPNQEILQKDSLSNNQNALEIPEYFENNVLKAQLQAKDTTIWKEIVENVAQIPIATTIAPGIFKIDLDPLAPRLLKNREAHIDYLKHTQEQADTFQGIVDQAKAKQPLDNALDFASCALGKSKKSIHQPKAEVTNQEKLCLLHMDLCSVMRVESIKGKKYILVIVDDYSRFTWVKFLRSKDEAPDAIIKCIKNIHDRLNATVRNV
ncbi:retrovirus-related pol polyprotein from transposon TNT 1-94 [Tanacetum coccineum]